MTQQNDSRNPAAGESRMLIGGNLVGAMGGATYPNLDPATEEIIGWSADGRPEDMEAAIKSARSAFDTSPWSSDRELRARAIRQLAEGLDKEKEHFRPEFIRETGIPLAISAQLLDGAIDALEYWADMASSYEYESSIPSVTIGGQVHRRHVWREPCGVVGVITPWNSPFQLNLMKLGPVLASGNTAILKPAPDTPWSGTVIGRVVAAMTEMPPGVLNVVTSSGNEIGDTLTGHPDVDGITFTGSTAVGRHVAARAAATIKKVTLELGGKSACIALDGADLAALAASTSAGVCWRAGQGCALITRLLVPRAQQNLARNAAVEAMKSFSTAGPFDPATFIGPLINRRQYERVLDFIKSGVDEGATLAAGGKQPSEHDRGFFVEPTLFTDVTRGMKIAREEIFGPVLVIMPYDSVDEAVDIANDTIYGLSAAVAGGSDDQALAVARRLRSGTCAVNGGVWFGVDAPFGGYKQSGLGRENGIWGFEEFLETKAVAVPA